MHHCADDARWLAEGAHRCEEPLIELLSGAWMYGASS